MSAFKQDVKYWTAKLEENAESSALMHARLCAIPCKPLTLMERIELRNSLASYMALSSLLSDAVQLELEKPKPFWKKLFQV